MKKYKEVLKRQVSDIICDICGKSCLISDPLEDYRIETAEYATLEATWGYWSKKDGDRYYNEMCEICFDKVKSYIDSIKQP